MKAAWAWYLITLNEEKEPASIAVDMSCMPSAPDMTRPCLACIRVPFLGDSGGKPAPPESESNALAEISDDLVRTLREQIESVFVGRLTTTKFREFFHYGRLPERFDASIEQVANRHPEYRILSRSLRDESRSKYREFLYPSERQQQWMQDRDTVAMLRKEGDLPSQPRMISHWAWFPTREHRDAFVSRTAAAGFQLRNGIADQSAPRARRFGAEVARVDAAELDHIHGVVLDLIHMASASEGKYDGWESKVTRATDPPDARSDDSLP